ncbi:MAG: DUF4124 domain-containing protein [Gammaproteobacteria bacterium]|nr:DUF4124 domain-containing protein [Gammaproteobacteria bacterium]
MKSSISILLLMFSGLLAAAEVYKWTDEQGRVHFSDRPLDEKSEQVQVTPSPQLNQSPLEQAEREKRRQRLLEVYREDRAKQQAQAAKRKHAKLEKQQKCRNAKRRHDRFNHAGGIYDENEQGERRYLNQQERARFMTELQAEIERWCG